MAVGEQLGEQFSAVPVHSPEQHSRLSLDPRLARKFLRGTTLAPEERAILAQYIITAKWQPKERAVYSAVVDGFTDIPSISTVTGLSEAEVNTIINKLTSKGIVRRITQ